MSRHPQELLTFDWEAMNEGDTVRIHCGHWKCDGKADSFTITRTFDGCLYNCYRCGCPGYPGIVSQSSSPSIAHERLNRIRNLRHGRIKIHNNNDIIVPVLPFDFVPLITYDKLIPPQAYAWLYKYELDDNDFNKYYIGYSRKLERIIFPIYDNTTNKLMAWQGRDVFYKRNLILYNNNKLKYKPLKYYTEYFNLKKIKLYYNIYNYKNIYNNIIIVEDIISAIKVYNKFKYNVTALLNSTITNGTIADLSLRAYNKVFIWLDPDARIKGLKAAMDLSLKGVNSVAKFSDTDPKDVSYKEMKL